MIGIKHWLLELAAAHKREKDWRKEGRDLLAIYEGEKEKRVPFNILYSNTETLLPSLYSAIPRPVVDRRFKDEDPLGKAGSEAGRRGLEFQLDTNIEGYETYDEAMRAATLDAILPGRGVTRVKYDAEVYEPEAAAKPKTDKADEEGKEGADEAPVPRKTSELVCTESIKWDHVRFGYATKWSNVPWVAFAEDVDKKEATRLFGKAMAARLKYSSADDDDPAEKGKDDESLRGPRETSRIYSIWSKSDRKVYFVSEEYRDDVLKVVDDPLNLTGFFPIPRPMQVVEKSSNLTPTSLYSLYKEQAEELNELTRRIRRIVRAIKAKGIYDSELGGDIKTLVEADDNELVPADKTSSLAAEKGLQNAIWMWPIQELIVVLRELLASREACKAVIWEIMGIADIMRGQSQASETLGAQKIKQSWGSLRLKRMQKEVQRYARDLLRMMLEVMGSKFSEDTWAKMTGLPFLTEQQFAQAQAQMQAAMERVQMAQMQPPPMQQDPNQPPPPNPAIQQAQQAAQAAQAELQKPRWADVIGMLKDDVQRAYRIDIETNSTVEPEAAEDQKNIAELMNAIAQFLNGVTPMIESGVMPFQAAQAMLLAIVRRYRFGADIEDQIKAMQQPQPKDDGKAAAEQAKMQAEIKEREADRQFQIEKAKAENQRILQSELAKHQRETQEEQNRMRSESEKLKAQLDSKIMELDAGKQNELAKLNAQRMTEKMKAQVQQETALQQTALQVAGQIEIARINAAAKAQSEERSQLEGAANAELSQQDAAETTKSIAIMAEALRELASPKMIERDKSGRAIRLVPQVASQ